MTMSLSYSFLFTAYEIEIFILLLYEIGCIKCNVNVQNEVYMI